MPTPHRNGHDPLTSAAIEVYGLLWRDLYCAPSPYAQKARAILRQTLTREQRKQAITVALKDFGSPSDEEITQFCARYP